MITKHTPGPWLIHKWESETYMGAEIKDSQDNTICIIQHYNNEANARLIKTAPRLLEACRLALKYLGKDYLGEDADGTEEQQIAHLLQDVLKEATCKV